VPVRADQAIFTSVRSFTGQGYRLVSASGGITADERKELTRRSPSHGSLCEPPPGGRGLAAYALTSGRHCVASSRYAGREHSSRGGERVYTHIAVLAADDFHRFECNPLMVETALLEASGHEVLRQLPAHMESLELRTPGDGGGCGPDCAKPSGVQADRLIGVVALVLAGDRAVVAAAESPRDILHWLVQAIPLVWRAQLSVCLGLKYSPARDLQLVFLPADHGLRGSPDDGVMIYHWHRPCARIVGPFDAWLAHVRREWAGGCHERVARRAARLEGPVTPADLALLVEMYDDIDCVAQADRATLERLLRQRAALRCLPEVVEDLQGCFEQEATKRCEELDRREAIASTTLPDEDIGG